MEARHDDKASSATAAAQSKHSAERPAADKVKKKKGGILESSDPEVSARVQQEERKAVDIAAEAVDIVAGAAEVAARVIQHADEELKDDPPFDADEVNPDPEGYDTDYSE